MAAAYAGKRVLITGANSGIGRAAALQLAKQGARVVVLARSPARNAEVEAALGAVGAQGRAIATDVTDDASVEAAVAEALRFLGGVDLLICNAGYAACSPVATQSLETMRGLMETNFWGHVRVVKAVLPAMKASRGGQIALVTSMLGFMSFYGYAAYSASKYAIVGFAEGLRQELVPYDIGLHVFFPPTTDTPGLEAENETKPKLTWEIEGTSTTYTADQVAASLLGGLAAKHKVGMVGLEAWAIYALKRWFPGLVDRVLDGKVHAWVRKGGDPL